MSRILVVAVLMAVILVASLSPALARPRHFGQNLGEDHPSCVATENAQNERGAHHVEFTAENPPPPPDQNPGCWVVLPSDQGE
jgi:hypothetical protein